MPIGPEVLGKPGPCSSQEYFEEVFLCLNSLSLISPWHHPPHSLHSTRTNHLLHSSIRMPWAWPTPRLLRFALQEDIPQNRNYLNLPSILQNSSSLTWIGKTFAQLSTTEKSRQSWNRSPRLFPVLLEEQSSPPRRLNRPFSVQQYLDLWCFRLEAKSH